tara:strand:- start:379 stop:966 length:588 start_codon:yes stop_codon:yes gene_type:complete
MLEFGSNSNIQSNTSNKRTGIFVSEATIKNVVVKYDVQEKWQKRPDDIAVFLTLDVGQNFDYEMRIGGYFNRKDDGSVKNWGAALKVKILLNALDIEGKLSKDFQLTDEILDEMIGKKFLRLSYVSGTKENGKPRWFDWNEVGKLGQEDRLKERFMKAVNDGWVKNFRPDTSDDFDPAELEKKSEKAKDVKPFVL